MRRSASVVNKRNSIVFSLNPLFSRGERRGDSLAGGARQQSLGGVLEKTGGIRRSLTRARPLWERARSQFVEGALRGFTTIGGFDLLEPLHREPLPNKLRESTRI